MSHLLSEDEHDAWVSTFMNVSPYPAGSNPEVLAEVASLICAQVDSKVTPEDAAAAIAGDLKQRANEAKSSVVSERVLAMDPLRVEIAELSLIKTAPSTGATRLVEVFGKTVDGRELVLSIKGDHLERLIKSLNASIRQWAP